MSDDEFRDGFGAEIAGALGLRSQTNDAADTVVALERRAHRRRSRRRLIAAAVAAAMVAAVVGILIGRNHGGTGVRTINPSNTTVATVPRTNSSTSTTRPPASTTTTVLVPPVKVPVTVTAARVGSLRFGVASAADVRNVVGVPDVTIRGSFGVATMPGYLALGYDCSNTRGAHGMHIGPYGPDIPPYCRTVFFINVDTSTLAGFATTQNGYATANGTTVGMTSAQARQHESQTPYQGCFTGISVTRRTPIPDMFVFVGLHPTDVVSGIEVDDLNNTVGVLFC